MEGEPVVLTRAVCGSGWKSVWWVDLVGCGPRSATQLVDVTELAGRESDGRVVMVTPFRAPNRKLQGPKTRPEKRTNPPEASPHLLLEDCFRF